MSTRLQVMSLRKH